MYVNFWLGVACSVHRSLFIHNLLPSHLTSTLRTWEMFEGTAVFPVPHPSEYGCIWIGLRIHWYHLVTLVIKQGSISRIESIYLKVMRWPQSGGYDIPGTRIAPREISRPVIYFIIQVNETLTWTFDPEILADWLGMSGLQTIWCQLVIQVIN